MNVFLLLYSTGLISIVVTFGSWSVTRLLTVHASECIKYFGSSYALSSWWYFCLWNALRYLKLNSICFYFKFLVVYGFVTYQRMTDNNGQYLYPIWVEYLGNLMCLVSFGSIVLYAIYMIIVEILVKKNVFNLVIQKAIAWS